MSEEKSVLAIGLWEEHAFLGSRVVPAYWKEEKIKDYLAVEFADNVGGEPPDQTLVVDLEDGCPVVVKHFNQLTTFLFEPPD